MNNVYLISEKTLKENSIINDNVDPNYLDPAMDLAQNVGLQQVIGTNLLDKLTSLVENGKIKEDENKAYKYLLDKYITNYLMYKVCSELTIILGYKYRNAGVIQTNNDHTSNTAMSDAQYMKNYYDDKASFFAISMINYIKANSEKYPEYGETKAGGFKNNDMAFDTGIFLG